MKVFLKRFLIVLAILAVAAITAFVGLVVVLGNAIGGIHG